jgi:hypothetical protein
MHDMQPDNMNTLPDGQPDREGAMARADLYKLANYSLKLFKRMQDEDQLEGWVQAKITKAADYIASVYHYLEYEMKISEYGTHLETAEMYSEGQKAATKNKLMEAKEKVKELKKLQAEKKSKEDAKSSVKEGIMSGGEESCTECGGTGMVYREATPVPDHVKGKVEKYKRQATAFHAASKRIDKNKNGIPDDEEVSEEQGELKKTGDSKKTPTGTLTKTDTGVVHKNTSYSDGGDADEQSGKGKKSHAKAQSAAEKKELAPKQKQSPKSAKTWGMKDGAKFDNRDKAVDETYGQGVYAEGKGDGNLANNAKPYDKVTRGDVIAGRLGKDEKGGKDKKVKETLKGDQDKIDVDGDKKIEKSDLAALRAGKKVDEASKPSAGMSKKEKSDTVKDAKAGKDIGKPGKSFDKVAKAAGGGEKGEKIAAAAMWKNKAKAMKESLDSMTTSLPAPEADDMAIGESDTQNELGALVKYASEKDPEGFAAAQNDPAKLFQFLQQFAEKDASDTGTGGAIGAPNTMPQAMEQTESDMVFESTEFDRMKTLMQRLNG